MKGMLVVCAVFAALLAMASNAGAQSIPATQCPLNYVCSLLATGVVPLNGSPQQGRVDSFVGFLSFDGSGNVTGTLAANANGTLVDLIATSGTCTSGSATSAATVRLITTEEQISFDFVVSRTGDGIDLQVNSPRANTDPGTPLTVGVCHAAVAG